MNIANFRYICLKYKMYLSSINSTDPGRASIDKDVQDMTILMYLDSYSMDDLYYNSKEFINQLCLRIKHHNFVNIKPLRLIEIPELLKLYNDVNS